MKMYQHIARQIGRLNNISKRVDEYPDEGDKAEYERMLGMRDTVTEEIEALVKRHFPHGSGFDAGTSLDIDNAKPNRYVFHTSFHHMNENGYYSGWTEHVVVVTPCMQFDYDVRVTGRNRNDIKDWIHNCFTAALSSDYEYVLHRA